MNRNKEACHCNNVTYGQIEDALKNGAVTLQEVQDATGGGRKRCPARGFGGTIYGSYCVL